jgi:hypothetical protein
MTSEPGRITCGDETDGVLKDVVELAIPVEEGRAAPPRASAMKRIIGLVALIATVAGLLAGYFGAGSVPGAAPTSV